MKKNMMIGSVEEKIRTSFIGWCRTNGWYMNAVAENLFQALVQGEIKIPKKVIDRIKTDCLGTDDKKRKGQKKGQDTLNARRKERETTE